MKWFDITDKAKTQMEGLLAKHPDKYAVSLSVLGGGCAGFKYYKEEVFGSQFEIKNPNSKSSCGCGDSFGV